MTDGGKCLSILGHLFQARYDFGAPMVTSARGGALDSVSEILEASKPRTYVYDICIRCGVTVKREPTPK